MIFKRCICIWLLGALACTIGFVDKNFRNNNDQKIYSIGIFQKDMQFNYKS